MYVILLVDSDIIAASIPSTFIHFINRRKCLKYKKKENTPKIELFIPTVLILNEIACMHLFSLQKYSEIYIGD